MPLLDTLADLASRLSHRLGFDTIDRFPPGHPHAATHWDGAYFDIASDTPPEKIDTILSTAISNTPLVFARITHPTPRMQRALLGVIQAYSKRGDPAPFVLMLMQAYASARTQEAVPGLRAAIERANAEGGNDAMRAFAVLGFLGAMPAPFDVIDASVQLRRAPGD